MPSASSIARIASDAAMNASTWRYFHRENELPFRRKSTRRAATSAGGGARRPNDSAAAAIGDAVRVVRVHDLGRELAS